ncbi:spermidine synthase [Microbacterium invictum]|uniref:Spermidine synthase n=1 Tax=Microbacterium invictum TaxID=515415 RepID=A0AA40SPU2_9MICO|nr:MULTISPECIES: fused MFS/spermidine synthase [Microbacterium]MBB4140168.1 spermidine synthase [Microbacterium invictum]
MARAKVEEPPPSARLTDGTRAYIVPSRFTTGHELIVDRTPQSHVDLDDPGHLHFEYVTRMGAVIDRLRMPGQPLTAVHLGAGALTLPRYIEHTRPGSRQQVVEIEQALVDLVREHLPLPRGAQIRMRIGDARTVAAKLPAGLVGTADLVVSDVFAGAQTPAHLTTVEYYETLARLLAADGVLLVNIADGTGLAYARRQVATIRTVLPQVIILAEVQTLKGRRFGNLVIAASAAPLPTEWLPRLMAAGPHPAKVTQGAEIDEFVRGARIATDGDAVDSPKPAASIFD